MFPLRSCLLLTLLTLAGIAFGQKDRPPVVTNEQAFLSCNNQEHLTLEGRVRDVFRDHADESFVFLVLDCGGAFVYAHCHSDSVDEVLPKLLPYVDHMVRVSGTVIDVPDKPYSRTVTRRQITVRSLGDIQAIGSPSKEPFDSPDIDSATPQLAEFQRCGKRSVTGVVTARWQGNRIILKKTNGKSMMVQFRDGIPLPPLGSSIKAEGQPETDLYRIHLIGAIWKTTQTQACNDAEPLVIPIEELFKVGPRFVINATHYGKLLTIRGTLKEFVADENGQRRLLLEDGGLTIQVDCNESPRIMDELEVGSRLSATGICVVDSDFWRPSTPFPKNKSLFLIARTAADVTIIAKPPWWTPFRLILALCLTLGALVLILIWNVALRILVERRSREVIRAQERKLESELRIGERTRLAADLHDSLSQNLTVIGYQVSAAQNTLGDKDPDTGARLSTAAKMIHSCRTDLRRCLWDLRNDVLDEPDFATAIRKTVKPVADQTTMQIRFAGRRNLLKDSTAHALLYIIRELVANAVRHGQATVIRIAGEARPDGVSVSVRDNGIGFDINHRPGHCEGHFGLDGIEERVERLQGVLTLESVLGNGTYARISIKKDIAGS